MRRAIFGPLVAAVSAAAMLTAGAGVANAAVSPNAVVTCSGTFGHKICDAHVFSGAVIRNANGGVVQRLSPNQIVTVTCWFTSGGVIQDHVTFPATGHVDDAHVNFNGNTPAQEGIGHCG